MTVEEEIEAFEAMERLVDADCERSRRAIVDRFDALESAEQDRHFARMAEIRRDRDAAQKHIRDAHDRAGEKAYLALSEAAKDVKRRQWSKR